jgi:hypothetical protein
MPPPHTDHCPHDRRPGTTVCLLCLRDARLAANARLRRTALRLGGGVLAVAIAATTFVSGGGLDLLTRRAPAEGGAEEPALQSIAAAPSSDQPVVSLIATSTTSPAGSPAAPPAEVPESSAPATPSAPTGAPPIAPIVRDGRTWLRDSLFVVRAGDTARVHFDTELARTRRPAKFEGIVRETLPAVYGPAAARALERLAPGALVAGGDLVADLPTRGVRVPLSDGWAIALWPETRPGRDGPLVVSYRARVVR